MPYYSSVITNDDIDINIKMSDLFSRGVVTIVVTIHDADLMSDFFSLFHTKSE